MAHIETRSRSDGSLAYRARISIKTPTGYRTVKKTFDSKREALAWAHSSESLKTSASNQEIAVRGMPTVSEMLSAYYEAHASKTKTAKWNLIRTNQLSADPLGQIKLDRMVPQDVLDWRDRRLQKVSASTVAREWNYLAGAFTWAMEGKRWISSHPMRGKWIAKQKPKGSAARDRLPVTDEIARLKHASNYPKVHTQQARTVAAFLFACYTGMRSGEIVALRWTEIDASGSFCRVTGEEDGACKTASAVRNVALSAEARAIIEWLRKAPAGEFVFGISAANRDALWRKLCKAAGVDDLRFHDSRHYAATSMARHLDAFALARQLGIADIRVIRDVYYNTTPEETANRLSGVATLTAA